MKEKLMRKLPLDHIMGSCEKNSGLKRKYRAELTMLGVGVIIGSGLFVITGVAAADRAGARTDPFPFILAGLACACAALCYAELACSHSSIRQFRIHLLM